MKNICFFNSLKVWGGGEKFYFEYALGFKKLGYNVMLACNKDSLLSQKAEENSVQQHNVKVSNLSFLNLVKLIRISRFYRRQKVDVVLFSTSQDLKTGGLAARMAGVKKIVYRRGLAVPVKNSYLNRYLLGKVVTHIVANSEETKRTILQNLSEHIRPDKIKVVYNGIKVEDFATEKLTKIERMAKEGKGIILGNAGRLTSQKGQRYLVEVAKKLKDKNLKFTLFIAGSGELKPVLEKQIKEAGLNDEVILLDFVKNIGDFMNVLDVFLLSSEWEGFGYVLAEAMVLAKPVVAYKITSNPEIVSDNETGYLVEYNDIDAFTDKVELLMKDKELRLRLGEAGRKRVLDKFQFKNQLKEFQKFLD